MGEGGELREDGYEGAYMFVCIVSNSYKYVLEII